MSARVAWAATSGTPTTPSSDYDWRVQVYAGNNGEPGPSKPLPGEVLTVYTHNKKVLTVKTNAKGFAVVNLPKGECTVVFSHARYLDREWATRKIPVAGPVHHVPGSEYDFILDTGQP